MMAEGVGYGRELSEGAGMLATVPGGTVGHPRVLPSNRLLLNSPSLVIYTPPCGFECIPCAADIRERR